jgi:hypothetical protein
LLKNRVESEKVIREAGSIMKADIRKLQSAVLTTDEYIMSISIRKDRINNGILNVMKEVAVDCKFNAPDNIPYSMDDELIKCFTTADSKTNPYMFHPVLEKDKLITASERGADRGDAGADRGKIGVAKQPILAKTGETGRGETVDAG